MLSHSIVPVGKVRARVDRPGWLTGVTRRLVLRRLEALAVGALTVRDARGEFRFGSETGAADSSAMLTVQDLRVYRHVAFGGALGAGAAYIQGYWQADDLTALIRLLIRNESALSRLGSGWGRLAAPVQRALHRVRGNTRSGSRRNIAAHYDLSNAFYRLFLDETMTYSCGVFEREDASLREASIAKLDRACRKLSLTPRDHVLEIGTGWGSFALHAARRYGCRVTTTTISRQQYEFAREAVRAAGLSDRVEVLQQDYRDLSGRYDKLVSIEMIEAVGAEYFGTFFEQCARLLKPEGRMLLQAITMAERYYDHARRDVDFIKRYVFPGSCIPSLGALTRAIGGTGDLQPVHVEDFGLHYARTLRLWRERFEQNHDEVRRLGFPPSFVRLWEYYLCYCEAGFRERTIGVAQMLLNKPQCRAAPLLPTREQLDAVPEPARSQVHRVA